MSSWAEGLTFFALTFGPGTAFAGFSSNLGWYEEALGSKEVTILMRFASLAPFPLIFFLQKLVDRRVDLVVGCKAGVFFRLLATQSVLVGLVVLWMVMPLRARFFGFEVPSIVAFGVPLAAFISANMGTCIKLAAATAPKLVIWAHLGNTCGTAVMVLWETVLGHGPDRSHGSLQRTLLLPFCACGLNLLLVLGCLRAGFFNKGLAQMESQHRPAVAVLDEEKGGVAEVLAAAHSTSEAQASLAQPLTASGGGAAAPGIASPSLVHAPAATAGASSEAEANLAQGPLAASECADAKDVRSEEGIAEKLSMSRWIKVWLVGSATGQVLDWLLLTLIAFFGDAQTTQSLAGLTFLANAAGSIAVLQLPRFRFFERGPCHKTNALMCLLRLAVCVVVLSVHSLPKMLLKVLWVSYFFNDTFQSSLTDLTATRFAPLALRSKIAHTNLMGTYGGMVAGLTAATIFSKAAHLGA